MRTNIGQNSGFEMTEEFKALLETMPSLESEDVADSVVYVLSTPSHVQVHELMVQPVGQQQL